MKYKLLERDADTGLYRIQALTDIPLYNVKAGDLGGYLENEANLSQEGDSWVSGNARVLGDAKVYGNAKVFGDAKVSGDAKVFGNAEIFEYAKVSGDARVFEYAKVSGNAEIFEYAQVFGYAWVSGDAKVSGNAQVFGDAKVFGETKTGKCLHIQQFKHNITMTDTHVFIGCQGHTWGYWFSNIETIGAKYNYTYDEIKQVRQLLLLHRKFFVEGTNHAGVYSDGE